MDAIESTPELATGDRFDFCAMGDSQERTYEVTYVGTACIGYDGAPDYPPQVIVAERRPVALLKSTNPHADQDSELPIYLHPVHGWTDARYTREAIDWEPSIDDDRVRCAVGY